MGDDALRGGIVNARKRLQVAGRGAIDVYGVLLLYTFNNALNHRLRIASSGRGCVSSLLADFIWAAIMRRAAEKNKRNQQ